MSLITTIAPCPFRAAETALRRFLLGHAEALVSIAGLLGEQPAVRRTARLLEELVDAPRLTRRLRLELMELHRWRSTASTSREASKLPASQGSTQRPRQSRRSAK